MMWFIFESALVNSWVLYKSTRDTAKLPLEYTYFEFRVSIALALASEWEAMGCVNRAGVLRSPTKEFAVQPAKKAKKSLQSWEMLSSRGQGTDASTHFGAIEKIPLLEGAKNHGNKRLLYCEFCKTRRTTVWCRICAAPLCQKRGSTCFHNFHTSKQELKK